MPATWRIWQVSRDSPGFQFFQGDICDPEALHRILKQGVDAVVNFAAESHVDRSILDASEFARTNIVGTLNLLQAARKAGVSRFLQISTDEVYGSLGATGAFTEESPLAPNSPYAASKASADLLARSFHQTYGFPCLITRCSNNYGPYQFPEKLIPLLVTNALAGMALPIYGDGLYTRDWIHVHDHCSALDRVLHQGRPGEVYNIGARQEKTNLEIVRLVLQVLGKDESLISFVADRPGHDRRYAIDSCQTGAGAGLAAGDLLRRAGCAARSTGTCRIPPGSSTSGAAPIATYYDRMYKNRKRTLAEL